MTIRHRLDLLRLVRRDWLFAGLLAAGLAFRVLVQLAYQPALVYIDSDRYLLGLGDQDPLGYCGMLWPLQRAGGLAAVAVAQHALGLGMAVTGYVVLRRRLWRWAAAIAVAPVLLDAYQLQAEQTIMPDVMFEALVVAGLACVLWQGQPGPRLVCAAGAAFGTAACVRQAGEVLIVPAVALVLVCGPRWRSRLVHGALAVAAFAAPVLAYMTVHYAVTGQFAITQRNADMLYARAAVAADCARLRLPADERALCPASQVVADLGIDGMLSDHDGPLLAYRPPAGTTTRAMAGRFALTVLRQQPLAVAGSVDRDLVKLFALTRDGSPGDPPISRWQFQLSYPTYPPLITVRYVEHLWPGGGTPRAVRPLAAILRGYQLHGGYTPGPFLALAALAGLAGACSFGGPRGGHVALASASVIVLGTVLAVLLACDAYEFSWRYQLPALVLLPMAGALGLAALTARFRAGPAARHVTRPTGSEGSRSGPPAWRCCR
jgi:hypothetical protein